MRYVVGFIEKNFTFMFPDTPWYMGLPNEPCFFIDKGGGGEENGASLLRKKSSLTNVQTNNW